MFLFYGHIRFHCCEGVFVSFALVMAKSDALVCMRNFISNDINFLSLFRFIFHKYLRFCFIPCATINSTCSRVTCDRIDRPTQHNLYDFPRSRCHFTSKTIPFSDCWMCDLEFRADFSAWKVIDPSKYGISNNNNKRNKANRKVRCVRLAIEIVATK